MKPYSIALEISGPTAMWTRPDTGDAPVSYPVPTWSAAKGIFESIVRFDTVEIVPTKVEICSPIIYHNYVTNYGGLYERVLLCLMAAINFWRPC